jgi:hypothetical protein
VVVPLTNKSPVTVKLPVKVPPLNGNLSFNDTLNELSVPNLTDDSFDRLVESEVSDVVLVDISDDSALESELSTLNLVEFVVERPLERDVSTELLVDISDDSALDRDVIPVALLRPIAIDREVSVELLVEISDDKSVDNDSIRPSVKPVYEM